MVSSSSGSDSLRVNESSIMSLELHRLPPLGGNVLESVNTYFAYCKYPLIDTCEPSPAETC
jgi:hypothetical protein